MMSACKTSSGGSTDTPTLLEKQRKINGISVNYVFPDGFSFRLLKFENQIEGQPKNYSTGSRKYKTLECGYIGENWFARKINVDTSGYYSSNEYRFDVKKNSHNTILFLHTNYQRQEYPISIFNADMNPVPLLPFELEEAISIAASGELAMNIGISNEKAFYSLVRNGVEIFSTGTNSVFRLDLDKDFDVQVGIANPTGLRWMPHQPMVLALKYKGPIKKNMLINFESASEVILKKLNLIFNSHRL